MSGIVGHTMYALLGLKAATQRQLNVAPLVARHYSSYLAGAYLGCDIQTLPEATCVDTLQEVGYGTVPIDKSPLTGGAVRPWRLPHDGVDYSARDVHTLFYGRSHLVFGFSRDERDLAIPWDHLPDYLALAIDDAGLFGPSERSVAYLLGTAAHIVGDCLIKSVQPGLDLQLLDGKYTPKNRPVQDLVTFHDVGRRELGVDWAAMFHDLASTPVEPAQLHLMRVGPKRGVLARDFPDGWKPDREALLRRVLEENRRYLQILVPRWLAEMELRPTSQGLECDERLRQQAGGLRYVEMLAAAERAGFRHSLWQMGEAVAEMFAAITRRSERLRNLPATDRSPWDVLTRRWQVRS